MRHDPGELAVDKIRKCLVPDAGHPVGRHIDRHARPELEAEEDAVEEGERPAERVAHDGDGRYGLRREGAFDGREYALCGAAWGVVSGGRLFLRRVVGVTNLACSRAKPLWASTDDGIPGKSDGSSGSRMKLASVRSAKLARFCCDQCHRSRKGRPGEEELTIWWGLFPDARQ